MTTQPRLGDEGSVLPLTLGYALLAIMLVLVSVDAMSLYLARKQLDTIADAAALAASDGFDFVVEAGAPRARLDPADVEDLATEVIAASGDAALVEAVTPDGVSARVTVATVWRPPVSSILVPDGVRIEATATSRTVLR
ncbi:pilus assembly protein TadG-related protein [Microbacterium sp. 2P01SA-2]|uniref:pilus assembly protein TadG-related protein n=1 Tax=unclassified Microbacterium TaxID=2609290 RepID=UPI00399F21DD